MSKKAIIKHGIKALVSGVFILVLISFVNTDDLFSTFHQIDWFYFGISLALVPVMLVASCLKWKVILDLHGESISLLRLLRIYLIGYLFSNILPSTVGGDVIRSFYAGKLIKNQAFAAVSVFLERFTGVLFLLLLAIFSPLLKPELYKSPYVYLPAIFCGLILCVLIWLMLLKSPLRLPLRLFNIMMGWLRRVVKFTGLRFLQRAVTAFDSMCQKLFQRLEKVKKELHQARLAIQSDPAVLMKIIVLTVLFYMLTWLNVYLSLRAFGSGFEFIAICALVPTIMFAAQLPVTMLGNLGYYESVFVFYFLLIGIPGAVTLAMGMLLRFKMLSIGLAGYLSYLCFSDKPSSLEES